MDPEWSDPSSTQARTRRIVQGPGRCATSDSQWNGGPEPPVLSSAGKLRFTELSRGRSALEEIKQLDETLFAHDYESL
jgi:hypothetical protein